MKRSLILVALLALVGAGGLILWSTTRATSAHNSEVDKNEVIVYHGQVACGYYKDRWNVKTGVDADVQDVDMERVVPTTIGHLVSLRPPRKWLLNQRNAPTELTIFRITGRLVKYVQEADSDYHLVLGDGSHTMIVEIPHPACVGASSPFREQIARARAAFARRYHVYLTYRSSNVRLTVTGVGFFDTVHGQPGVAPNGIELHPVLSVRFQGRSRGEARPTATPTPAPTPTDTPAA